MSLFPTLEALHIFEFASCWGMIRLSTVVTVPASSILEMATSLELLKISTFANSKAFMAVQVYHRINFFLHMITSGLMTFVSGLQPV